MLKIAQTMVSLPVSNVQSKQSQQKNIGLKNLDKDIVSFQGKKFIPSADPVFPFVASLNKEVGKLLRGLKAKAAIPEIEILEISVNPRKGSEFSFIAPLNEEAGKLLRESKAKAAIPEIEILENL